MCRDSPNSFDQIKKVLISNHVTGPIQTESIKGEPPILTWSDHLIWDNLCPPKFEFQSWNYYEFLLRPGHITLFLIGPWRVCSFWGRIELQNGSKWPKMSLIWSEDEPIFNQSIDDFLTICVLINSTFLDPVDIKFLTGLKGAKSKKRVKAYFLLHCVSSSGSLIGQFTLS